MGEIVCWARKIGLEAWPPGIKCSSKVPVSVAYCFIAPRPANMTMTRPMDPFPNIILVRLQSSQSDFVGTSPPRLTKE